MDAANVLSSGGCASIDPETMPVLEIPGKSSLSRTHSKEPAGARLLCRTRVSLRHNGRVTSWRLTSQKRREPIDQLFYYYSWWFSSSSSCWLAGLLSSRHSQIHSRPIVLCFCLIQLDNARLESIHRLSSCLIDSILHIYDAWTAITDSGFTASQAGYTNDEKSSQFRATVLSPYSYVRPYIISRWLEISIPAHYSQRYPFLFCLIWPFTSPPPFGQ